MAAERLLLCNRGVETGNWGLLLPEHFPHLLDKIFHQLPVQDLLSCSVVAKNWKTAARDILKESRECYAPIKYFPQDLEHLNDMIASTDIMEIINDLYIRNDVSLPDNNRDSSIPSVHEIQCSQLPFILQHDKTERKLKEAKQKIQAVLAAKWKYLYLDMGSPSEQRVTLVDALLLREIIFASCDSLQKILMGQEDNWRFIPCCGIQFSQLKAIQAAKKYSSQRFSIMETSFSVFVPKLEEITGAMMEFEVHNPVDTFVLERTKSISVVGNQPVPEGRLSALKFLSGLHRLDLQSKFLMPNSNQDNNRRLLKLHEFVFPSILKSLSTLVELRTYTLWLHNLYKSSNMDIQFPYLRLLSLATHKNVTVDVEVSILKQLNLPKLCPNLEQMHLGKEESFDSVKADENGFQLWDGMDQSDKPMTIDLEYRNGQYSYKYVTFFSTIYPKLAKVRILQVIRMSEYEMKQTFENLNSLDILEINFLDPSFYNAGRIETLLSGINVGEAQMLFAKYQINDEELNSGSKTICPLLLNVRNLKEVKFTQEVPSICERIHRNWFIEVSENFPERRKRSLNVTFDASVRLFNRLCLRRVMRALAAMDKRTTMKHGL